MEDAAATIREYGGRTASFTGTLHTKIGAQNVLKKLRSQFQDPDVLINVGIPVNAATTQELAEEEWDAIIESNLNRVFFSSQAALESMAKLGQGSIICVTYGLPLGHTSYISPHQAVVTAGVCGLVRHLAREFGPKGIRVNAIVAGPISNEVRNEASDIHHKKQSVYANIPLGRLSMPEDVARTVAFLASDDSNYISGATITATGGAFIL
jgi:3-oxoacyl-[acyl-carrier protein] reductase